MPFRSHGVTDVGKKRDHNEDAFFISDKFGLYLVADGMGGHAAGEVASAKAVEVISEFVKRCQDDTEFTWPYGINPELTDLANTLVTAIKLANREVWRIAQEKPEHQGMGTTVVSIYVEGSRMAIAHVGDSRVYLVRDGNIIQKTRDHSWVNEQLVRGIISPEEAKNHRWKNVITRALGNKEQIEVDVSMLDVKAGDILLLCSDGMCFGEGVEEEDVLRIVLEHQSDLKSASQVLIGLANEANGKDNITAVLVKSFATEEEADAEVRDHSNEDTNPMAVRSIAPPGMDIEKTAEVSREQIDEEVRRHKSGEENLLNEPIAFDDDESTPPMGAPKTSPATSEIKAHEADEHADNLSLDDVFEADGDHVLGDLDDLDGAALEELDEPGLPLEEAEEQKKSGKTASEGDEAGAG